jgi:hypothetical protein
MAGLMGIAEAELEDLFDEDLHAKRIESLAGATIGALTEGRLGVHAIGIGLAEARGLRQKHTIKQVDRLLSNAGLDVWDLFDTWVPYVLAQREEALVALDWTDFDDDDQSTLWNQRPAVLQRIRTAGILERCRKEQIRMRRSRFVERCFRLHPRRDGCCQPGRCQGGNWRHP